MIQPFEQRVPLHKGGCWPASLLEISIDPACNTERAVMEVASAARRFRQGVRAFWMFAPLLAYPHEEVEEIYARWKRHRDDVRRAQLNPDAQVPPVGFNGRWSPSRKLNVLIAVATGELTPETVEAAFGVSPQELREWSQRFDLFGYNGLCSSKVTAVGRVIARVLDPDEETAAAG